MTRSICNVSKENKVTIPKGVVDEMGLKFGTTIYWKVENGKLIGTVLDLDNME